MPICRHENTGLIILCEVKMMLNILIVDDDFLVRTYLLQFINWEKYGYTVIGQASNGKEAFKMAFAGTAPDIIITDVCMPMMGGVELIESLKKAGHTARILILSCHDDFAYVKKAMQLGADEYLLKNDLQEDVLLQSLAKIKEKLFIEKRDTKSLHKLAKMGLKKMQQDFVKMLDGVSLNSDDIDALLFHADIKAQLKAYSLFLITCQDKFSKYYASMCLTTLKEIAYPLKTEFYMMDIEADKLLLCADFSHVYNDAVWLQCQRKICEKIRQFSLDYFSQTIFIAAGNLYNGKNFLQQAYKEVKMAAKMQFFANKEDWLITGCAVFSEILPKEGQEFFKDNFTQAHTQSEYEKNAQDLLVIVRKKLIDPDILLAWLKELDECLQIKRSSDFYDKVKTIDVFARILFNYACKLKHDNFSKVTHAALKEALVYIENHYMENFSLSIIADYVALSPAYFSYLFKTNMGISFLEYLTIYRIGKVKTAMLDNRKKLKEIAADAGFTDYQHFCKVFKNNTGDTPTDYRKQLMGH